MQELKPEQTSKVAAKHEVVDEIKRWEGFSDPEELTKEIKKLGKKLRQIEELEQKAKDGGELDELQKGKIANQGGLREEQKRLLALQASLSS